MAFWPRDQRKDASTSSNRAKGQARNYPNLEHGLIGAATLAEDDDRRLTWIYAAKNCGKINKSSNTRVVLGREVQINPGTQCMPSENLQTTIRQRAERGANFLRTFIPDVEIPEELIRQQLIEDTTRSRALRLFDPYVGNLIDVLDIQSSDDKILAAYASGETNQDLRYTNICFSEPSLSSDKLLRTFKTPMQQIASPRFDGQSSSIAVRTYGATHILQVKIANLDGPSVNEGATLTRKSFDNEDIVDMKYSSAGSDVAFVGDRGSVFNYDTLSGSQYRLPSAEKPIDSDGFWRLSLGPTPSEHFIMSNKNIFHLDKRTDSSTQFFGLTTGKNVFTSIENSRSDCIVSVCSTNQVIWMDVRFPRIPLLTYAHGREYDRYLTADTINGSIASSSTILTSRHNSMVTVYDISRSLSGLVSLDKAPYYLAPHGGMYQKHIGQRVINRRSFSALLQLFEGGGVNFRELLFSDLECGDRLPFQKLDIRGTIPATRSENYEDVSSLARQEYTQVDLGSAYEEMFVKYFEEKPPSERNPESSTYRLPEYLPSQMLNTDLPTRFVLTTRNTAFRESFDCQTTFLSDIPDNMRLRYQALKEGTLSPQLITAPWHASLLPTLQKFDQRLSDSVDEMEEYLKRFSLIEVEENNAARVRQYEEQARQQLILDLAVSFDVFSDAPRDKDADLDQSLENMTEALSLGDEPPLVEFGFLKPVDMKSYDPDKGSCDAELDIPIGVRLLLQGWDTSDPDDFVYQDSYNAANEAPAIKVKKSQSQSQSQVPFPNSQKPPTVLPSNAITFSQPDAFRKSVPKVVSQTQTQTHIPPLFEYPSSAALKSQEESQEYMTSTQILPGPHGGRPPNAKKKPAKKRLGGF